MHIEYLLALLALAIAAGVPLAAIILSIVALVRTRQTKELARRVDELESAIRGRTVPAPPLPSAPPTPEPQVPAEIVEAEAVAAPGITADEPPRESLGWEAFVGQKALGWIAVLLFVLAAAFFLRYAYQNNWIGPVGRVAIGALAGAALVMVGYRYQRRGWRVLSQMFSSGGVVVLYLATYSAFGFYHLLPYQQAGLFLGVIVIESMIIAALYDSLAIGLVAVLGGLATPLLLQSEQDAYVALFTYLAVLDLGTLLLMLARSWPAIGTVALLGTHGLFWSWYAGNYHPEKLAWALGFQVAVYVIFLAHTVVSQWIWKRREDWDGLLRLVLNAILGFAAFYVLLKPDYGVWMGSAAIAVAIVYALLARFTLTWRPDDDRLLLSALSVAVGFVALAFPLQADANWVSFGWAATAAALWWFGQRIAAPALRIIAAVLAGCAVYRLLLFDMPHGIREPFIPVLNDFGLPAVGVVTCLLAAVVATRPFLPRLGGVERFLTAAAGVVGVLLLWLVLSVECYGFFKARTRLPDVDPSHLLWLGQLSLSVLWAVYASVVLAVGFRIRLARLRWLAIVIYGVTVVKVLLVDMANLQQFYRILAFFILAIVLGLAAFAYQRLKPSETVRSTEES